MWIPKLKLSKKPQKLDSKQVNTIVEKSLEPYIKKEELEKYLKDIEKDERKKKIWNSMTKHQQMKLLRYVFNKKEAQEHEKGRR